ncbi:MAG: prolyl oligopeptidase family serine peptidase [bacterium]|nr:prolyl oligopeptidase family serine peptidase [bacterium]
MRNIALFTLIIALATAAFAGDVKKEITVDGENREYYVHASTVYDGSEEVPLVLVLHGGGGKATKMDKLTGMNDIADTEGFIVVYPQGKNKRWNDGRKIKRLFNKKDMDDVKFLGDVVKKMTDEYNIDESRVYSTGISNGSFMSYRLASENPDTFAAVAGVAAQVSENLWDEHTPKLPIPVMMVLGDNDPLVPYEGGDVKVLGIKRGRVLSTEDSVSLWVDNNGCGTTPTTTYYNDSDPDDGSVVRRDEYTSADNDDVVLLTVEGGGHCWPGGWQYLGEKIVGKTNRDVNASEVIWDFFEGHQLNINSASNNSLK